MAWLSISNQDELLRLTGTSGNPFDTITTTSTGTGAYFGPDRTVQFHLAVVGPVTGTSPSMTVKFQDSVDGTNSFADIGVAFAAVTGTQTTVVGNLAALPTVVVKTSSTRPYLRVVRTLTGTSPSFGSVAVLHSPPQSF